MNSFSFQISRQKRRRHSGTVQGLPKLGGHRTLPLLAGCKARCLAADPPALVASGNRCRVAAAVPWPA